jgi:hypothetical protein
MNPEQEETAGHLYWPPPLDLTPLLTPLRQAPQSGQPGPDGSPPPEGPGDGWGLRTDWLLIKIQLEDAERQVGSVIVAPVLRGCPAPLRWLLRGAVRCLFAPLRRALRPQRSFNAHLLTALHQLHDALPRWEAGLRQLTQALSAQKAHIRELERRLGESDGRSGEPSRTTSSAPRLGAPTADRAASGLELLPWHHPLAGHLNPLIEAVRAGLVRKPGSGSAA